MAGIELHHDGQQDHDEQDRENADHHGDGKLGGEAVGLFLRPREPPVAHVIAVDACHEKSAERIKQIEINYVRG